MFPQERLQPCKITNGFYIRKKKHSDIQIGMQNMDAEEVYAYRYNSETRRHEGQWCRPDKILKRGQKPVNDQ